MNRPTETGVGAEPVSKRLQERMKRQREEAERREKTYLAFCDAAVNAYLAQKEATS